MERSLEKITYGDLNRVFHLANSDINNFFERHERYSEIYKNRLVLAVLGQGAALHYIDGKNGVKDFDVWFFFPRYSIPLPYRRRGVVDFGPSKFGKHPNDHKFSGRRIDVLMRSETAFNDTNSKDGLIRYLSEAKTHTAKLLSKKAMVGLWPQDLFGKVLWPHSR